MGIENTKVLLRNDINKAMEQTPEAAGTRDEIGLIRAICVKARSSSQRKELFKTIQVQNRHKPQQLLLDMKVRWGSTYAMLNRAESNKSVCRCKFFLTASLTLLIGR